MTPAKRRDRIIQLVRENDRVTVDHLAEWLKSSRETIRRDLGALDSKGLLKKIHGGAISVEANQSEAVSEGSFQARLAENAKGKRLLARAAAGLLRSGDTVFVDTGTTTVFLAEEIARCEGITVITNSGAIASQVVKGKGNKVFLLGGEYREGGSESVGPLTIDQIGRFNASHSIITVGAVSQGGFLDYDLQETDIAKAMIAQSAKLFVLADSTKFGRSALFQVCPLAAADIIITDEMLQAPYEEALAVAGVEVVVGRNGL
ncbi:MAG: DeoR/GlpR family DNA-binding transcription regulator [Rhizobiaceae bacterium]|nr:DeoR/GlpR family DNA-binding transcription regulator [Rhizobiaceae bacterium]